MAKPEVSNVTQHAVGNTVNKQVKGKRFWPRGSVTQCIKHWKSRDSFLKWVKENNRKKEVREKGAWIQLRRQPAPPGEAHFL
ncbi:rCG56518 [Rattus norvegicus]|uniref:RCG56518 n=1 Tax=Rattus norvegicus TaxID=10116 RepID=A6IBG5_RAT|nr:rCG56518 [Rattus norvegicus]